MAVFRRRCLRMVDVPILHLVLRALAYMSALRRAYSGPFDQVPESRQEYEMLPLPSIDRYCRELSGIAALSYSDAAMLGDLICIIPSVGNIRTSK